MAGRKPPLFVKELERKGQTAKAKILFHFYDALCRKEGEIPALESDELKEQLTKLLYETLISDEGEVAKALEEMPVEALREHITKALDEVLRERVEKKLEEVKKDMKEYYDDLGDGIIAVSRMVRRNGQENNAIYREIKDVKEKLNEQERKLKDNVATWGRSLIGVITGRGG